MTLTDPVAALADDCSFIGYLVGLASIGRVVRTLAGESQAGTSHPADDFVHLLVGLAGVGACIEGLVEPSSDGGTPRPAGDAAARRLATSRWLR
jgi:hypothetical protein